MKTTVMKIAILGIILASAAQFLGATVWEGVSTATAGKDLPGTYSVATNSFPRNTVVEITNLENGKKVRAIVVSGLDSTGLLAVLSQNAAASIGLQSNFTCRIKMTEAANGNGSSIAALGPILPILPLPSAAESTRNRAANRNNNSPTSADNEPLAAAPQTAGPQTAFPQSEPEPIIGYAEYMNGYANGAADAGNYADGIADADTVDADDFDGIAIAPNLSADDSTNSYTDTAEADNPNDYAELAGRSDFADAGDTGNRTDSAVAAGYAANGYTSTVPTDYSEPVSRTEHAAKGAEPPAYTEPMAPQPMAAQSANLTNSTAAGGYTAGGYTAAVPVNRSDSVSRNNRAAEASVPPASAQSAATQPASAQPTAAQPAAVQPAQSGARLVMLPAEERIPKPIDKNAAPSTNNANQKPKTQTVVPSADFSPFQAPLISRLEQGKWYVQLGAYKRVDHVEDEISRIGTAYPVAVQNIGTDTNPMFRILLGPLNQGESGAMLQRFKSIGYADAFVWHN